MYFSVKIKKKMILVVVLILIVLLAFINIKTLTTFGEKKNIEDGVKKLPIIMYHGITRNRNKVGKYVVHESVFEEDLKYIKDKGYETVFMGDLINYVYEGVELPEKPIILTFDDGYYNNYLYAFDLVKKYDCKMVLSPIGKCIDQYSKIEDKNPNYAHCNWDDIREMINSGYVEIQNHSYDLHFNSSCLGSKIKGGESRENYKKRFTEDLMKMQQKMLDNTGYQPSTFTYPFGAKCDYADEFIKEMGFKASLDCEEKVNEIHKSADSLYNLHRFLRSSQKSSKDFFDRFKLD